MHSQKKHIKNRFFMNNIQTTILNPLSVIPDLASFITNTTIISCAMYYFSLNP